MHLVPHAKSSRRQFLSEMRQRFTSETSVNHPRALRRVPEWADGWIPALLSTAEFAEGVKRIKAIAPEMGPDPDSLEFSAFGTEQQWKSTKDIRELEQAGATRVVLWLNGQDLESILPEMENLRA